MRSLRCAIVLMAVHRRCVLRRRSSHKYRHSDGDHRRVVRNIDTAELAHGVRVHLLDTQYADDVPTGTDGAFELNVPKGSTLWLVTDDFSASTDTLYPMINGDIPPVVANDDIFDMPIHACPERVGQPSSSLAVYDAYLANQDAANGDIFVPLGVSDASRHRGFPRDRARAGLGRSEGVSRRHCPVHLHERRRPSLLDRLHRRTNRRVGTPRKETVGISARRPRILSTFSWSTDLLDRLSLAGSIAWVASKYEGRAPVNREIDDGSYHPTWQDAGLDVRWHFLDKPLAMAAAVGYGLPVTDYATTGHSVVGRGLDELRVALYAGILMGSRAYAHGGYTYGMADETQGYSLHRQLIDIDLGYSVMRWLTVRGYGVYQLTQDGVDWVSDDPSQPCSHCPGGASVGGGLANENFVQVGFGLVSPVSTRISLTANASTTVWGENIEDISLFSIGMSWLLRSPASKADEWGEDW